MILYSKKWFFTVLVLNLLTFYTVNAEENNYIDEIKALQLRTATLIDYGRQKIDQITVFKNAWLGAAFYISDLHSTISLAHSSNSFEGDTAFLSLYNLIQEKVLLETVKSKIELAKPKVTDYIARAAEQTKLYPELALFHNPMEQLIPQELQKLTDYVTQRSVQVEERIKIWNDWQMQLVGQAEIAHVHELDSTLDVTNDIGQVGVVLNMCWLDALKAIYEKDFVNAKNIIQGHAWLLSVIPSYFGDKIGAENQTDFLSQILATAKENQLQLTAYYKVMCRHASWSLFAEEGDGGGDHEGAEEGEHDEDGGSERDDAGNFPKNSKDVFDIGVSMPDGSNRTYKTESYDGSRVAVVSIQKGVCKYDDAGNGKVEITAEGKGFIQHDAAGSPVAKEDMPSGPELQKSIDRDVGNITYTFSGCAPCNPNPSSGNNPHPAPSPSDIKDRSDRLGKMIDQAKTQAKNDQDKKNLDELQKALNAFQDYQKKLNGALQEKLSHMEDIHNDIKNKMQGVSQSLKPLPSKQSPPPLNQLQIGEQLAKLRSALWNKALTTGNYISNTLNNFIQQHINKAPGPLKAAANSINASIKKHSNPTTIPTRSYNSMTAATRESILKQARQLRDGATIIKYSQSRNSRTGPDSFDCSGFVSTMYDGAGLSYNHPSVQGIIGLSGPKGIFKEVSINDAQAGDLIIWRKEEDGNTYDHVAIYDGEQTVTFGSGATEKGPAVISTSSSAAEDGRNAIQEILIKYMMGDRKNPIFHIFKWNK